MGRQNSRRQEKVYRLTLAENDTHSAKGSIVFTRARAISWAVVAVVAFILLIYCIIAFTPLRNTIPGYPDANFKKTALANAIKIDSLESAVTKWNLYASNLSRVLSGESTISFDSLIRGNAVRYLSDKSREELAAKDSLLRETVQNEERFGVSAADRTSTPVEGLHFFTPVKGVVATGYDAVSHPAIDISSPAGKVVSSVLDGTVIYAEWNDEGGYIIIVQHRDNLISIYDNSRKTLVAAGDVVKAGTPIALTGGEEGAGHLHFELWHNGRPINPTRYISF